ncbi:LysR family transcriptional regulator [Raoultella ornithinolytica]|jgi:DNA-binding transcriptional LysR family regulator|uniref:LysR family transcriptional regulator n=1 Tax=Raoultella TaxID=160674 RepID=UPI000FA94BBF|nr:LysR family transcriptional regulator [Raoultella ornithinolytica]QLJ45904.1 LysR family transcriptional regulator [Raoultella ornithinolytica]
MLDLNHVSTFVHVVRCGSFAEASRRLGVPPNTLSRRVQQLEEQLGTRLMQRTTRHLALTAAGQAFHDRCADAVDGLFDAGQELISGNNEPSGLVRVAAPADFFDFFPMEWMNEFMASYPRVRLDFVLNDSRANLIAERIDVAVRGGILEDSSFFARKVFNAGSDGLVASPDYLAARGAPQTLQDLADHDCLFFSHPSGQGLWRLTAADGSENEVRVAGRFSANTAQALRKATLSGLGIALLPSTMTMDGIKSGALIRVLPQYSRKGHGLNLVYPSRHHLPPAVFAFIDMVAKKLGDKKN